MPKRKPATDNFADDVRKGLTAKQKYLHSKYFYDARGDELFQAIMQLPEYYPTRCEEEILQTYKTELLQLFQQGIDSFRLIEFGAGDGSKTKILLEHFMHSGANFSYHPIDISAHVLQVLQEGIQAVLPQLSIEPIPLEYFDALDQLNARDNQPKILLFMGASIGNFEVNDALRFLKRLASKMKANDLLLLGIDLKKYPWTILDAYNDKQGVTRQFNLNLLERINRELDANFDLDGFIHYPTYDPVTGAMRSYLVSKRKQTVNILAIGKTIQFSPWETINMELSQKYDLKMINSLARRAGFKPIKHFFDDKNYFVNTLWGLR